MTGYRYGATRPLIEQAERLQRDVTAEIEALTATLHDLRAARTAADKTAAALRGECRRGGSLVARMRAAARTLSPIVDEAERLAATGPDTPAAQAIRCQAILADRPTRGPR